MALEMGYPAPAEFLKEWYILYGCLTCTDASRASPVTARALQSIEEMKAVPDAANGALQITAVNSFNKTPSDVSLACAANVNNLAVSDPDWSRRLGKDNLIKIFMACHSEAQGYNAPGYTQEVTTLASQGAGNVGGTPGGFDKRLLWVAGVLGLVLVLRARR